jgi:hypothetical protein
MALQSTTLQQSKSLQSVNLSPSLSAPSPQSSGVFSGMLPALSGTSGPPPPAEPAEPPAPPSPRGARGAGGAGGAAGAPRPPAFPLAPPLPEIPQVTRAEPSLRASQEEGLQAGELGEGEVDAELGAELGGLAGVQAAGGGADLASGAAVGRDPGAGGASRAPRSPPGAARAGGDAGGRIILGATGGDGECGKQQPGGKEGTHPPDLKRSGALLHPGRWLFI